MMRRTPMKRGTKPLARSTPLRANSRKKRPHKTNPELDRREYVDACFGEPCYLRIPGVKCAGIKTVVPCHSNQGIHGKGGGLKAYDIYTVPGCMHCHHELDQGRRLSREQRADIWNRAYERWISIRNKKMSSAESVNRLPK